MTTFCNKCNRDLPTENFYVTPQGLLTKPCRQCVNERRKKWVKNHPEWNANKARKWRKKNPLKTLEYGKKGRNKSNKIQKIALNKIRSQNPCFVCGESRLNCLEFHHLDPSKKERLVTAPAGLETVLKESEKCIILCANCHALYHAGDIVLPEDIKPLVLPSAEWVMERFAELSANESALPTVQPSNQASPLSDSVEYGQAELSTPA